MQQKEINKRVLVVKMSSFGDIIHTFPALADAATYFPNIKFDWVVERPFKDLPFLSKHVNYVYVNDRRLWRENRFSIKNYRLRKQFLREISEVNYDAIIEVQYTRKGAQVVKPLTGKKFGLDALTANDSDISKVFDKSFYVSRNLPAVERTRKLFALSLGYEYCDKPLQFDIRELGLPDYNFDFPYVIFIVSTTWPTKHMPLSNWVELIQKAKNSGYKVLIPWLSINEKEVAKDIIKRAGWGEILPLPVSADEWAKIMDKSEGVIGVDTGLLHLSGALANPTLGLFGPTNPFLTGVMGERSDNVYKSVSCAPCMSRSCKNPKGQICFELLDTDYIWQKFLSLF